MNDPRTTRPEIIGIEIGAAVVRGARVDCETNEVIALDEIPFGHQGVDADGVIEPSVVGTAVDTLLVRLGVEDRSQVHVGMTIGPRNAGVGSGPAMPDWLRSQAGQLGQPLVCSGGLGVAFVPIRSVDQAVKTAFDVGVELARVDLAPVAAARAIGNQVDDLVCVGSGRGWQARMRDFEVLEAMENPRVGPEEPVTVIGPYGAQGIDRYGWIDLSTELGSDHRVDLGAMATAVGAAIGVLYESPANLLSGKVVGAPERAEPPVEPEPRPTYEGERTIQLAVSPMLAQAELAEGRPVEDHTTVLSRRGRPEARPQQAAPERQPVRHEHRESAGQQAFGPGRVAVDDPINLFSPEADEHTILGKQRYGGWSAFLFAALIVAAVGLGAAYLVA